MLAASKLCKVRLPLLCCFAKWIRCSPWYQKTLTGHVDNWMSYPLLGKRCLADSFVFYINNCPTRCNTKKSIYYSASSLYMFRVSTTPIIRSIQNCNYRLRYCAATSLQRGQGREVATQKIWPVPEAVVTVLCTPDDGCGLHPKHVQWTCRIINRLLCVASRWTIININAPVF